MMVGSLTAKALAALGTVLHTELGSREIPADFRAVGLRSLRDAAEHGCHEVADAVTLLVGIAAITNDLDGFLSEVFMDMELHPEGDPVVGVRRVLKAHLAKVSV